MLDYICKAVGKKILTIFLLFLPVAMTAQPGITPVDQKVNYIILDTLSTPYCTSIWYVNNNDTLVKATYTTINIEASSRNRAKKNSYDRLERKVIKVYPYAKAAGDIMKKYELLCQNITDSREQKRLLDEAENSLKEQFEKDLRGLTISEGVILIKLIDRETGNTSFKLVQDLKGKFSAFMWQGLARVFGHNLKDDYDGAGEDVWIENIVLRIEDGEIPVELRNVDPFGSKLSAVN